MWIRIPRRMCSQRPKAKLVETRVQRRSLVLTQNLLHQMHLERQRLQRPTQAKRHSTTFLRHLRRSHRTRLLMQPTHPLPGSASRTGLDLGSVDSRPASRSCSPNLPDSIHSHHKSPYHQVLLCHWRRNTHGNNTFRFYLWTIVAWCPQSGPYYSWFAAADRGEPAVGAVRSISAFWSADAFASSAAPRAVSYKSSVSSRFCRSCHNSTHFPTSEATADRHDESVLPS